MGTDFHGCIEEYREFDIIDDYYSTVREIKKWCTILDLEFIGRDSAFFLEVVYDDPKPVPKDSSFFENYTNYIEMESSQQNVLSFSEFIKRYETMMNKYEHEESWDTNLKFFKRLYDCNVNKNEDKFRVVMFLLR